LGGGLNKTKKKSQPECAEGVMAHIGGEQGKEKLGACGTVVCKKQVSGRQKNEITKTGRGGGIKKTYMGGNKKRCSLKPPNAKS